MQFSLEILNELKGISPILAGIEKRNVFSVPVGYFDRLYDTINDKVKIDSFIPEKKSKSIDFSVPEGYFENLSNSILQKIKLKEDYPAQELKSLSPMLYAVQNENVFTVPADYFSNLSENILNKTLPKQEAKIVAFRKRNFVSKYAVAAVMTCVIGISSLLVYYKGNKSPDEFDQVYQQASQYKNEQQINSGISTLSDDDIIKYLEKTTTDADNQTLNVNIEEKELPAKNDYLQDEKTLDTYLDKIDAEIPNN